MKHENFPNVATEPADRLQRANVTLLCEVRQGMGPWALIRLDDISERGFRIAWFPNCAPDMLLNIRLPGIQKLDARVCWQEGHTVGCEFTKPLHIYVLEHIVRQATIDR